MNLRETAEYKEHGFKIVTCPVCGNETLNMNWICGHCGWEYDNIESEDEYSAANGSTVKDYREKYLNS